MKRKYNDQNKSKLTRVGTNFVEEIEDIQKERLEQRIDKKKKSIKLLTDKIIKHVHWGIVRKDLVNTNFKEDAK